jgi:hypothetical protein
MTDDIRILFGVAYLFAVRRHDPAGRNDHQR